MQQRRILSPDRSQRAGHFWVVFLTVVTLAVCARSSSAQSANAIPNFCAYPTVQSVRNGAWSDPATWSGGQVPTVNDRVAVAPGTTVTYDQLSDADLVCVNVFGQLTFRSDISTRLTVGTLTVLAGGGLQIGTLGAPVAAGVTAEIVISDRPLDAGVDSEQYGTGLLGFGRITMHGAVKTPTFVRLAAEATAGQSALALASGVSGWRAGDRLVLPGTSQSADLNAYPAQWETPTVASAAGSAIGLASGLAYPHRTGGSPAALDLLPFVGNMTRNVIVRSQNPAGTRGHVLLTAGAEVDIRYTAFKDLGRTTIVPLNSTVSGTGSRAGRYSLHLDRLVIGPTAAANNFRFVLIGNAIDGGIQAGITIHSQYGLVQDSVVYNTGGAGILTEDSSEITSVIQNNFIVTTPTPSGTGQDSCRVPDPFISLGGGTCVKDHWLPRGLPAPRPANTPTPPAPSAPTAIALRLTPATPTAECQTPDPYRNIGGGTCSSGTWVPPRRTAQASAADRASTPTSIQTPPSTDQCTGTDPYEGLLGLVGMCSDGKWVPVRTGTAIDSDHDGVVDTNDQCPGTPSGTRVNPAGCAVAITSASTSSSTSPSSPSPPPPPTAPAINSTISLNANVRHQTVSGWEGAALASSQDYQGITDTQLSQLLDLVANDIGLSRVRLTAQSGLEGAGSAFKIVNDNNDPNVINPSGFRWASLDDQIDRFIIPMRQRLAARGAALYVNLNYVDLGQSTFEHNSNPAEYAEFMLAVFQHMQTKYGFVPNAIEIMIEPNDVKGWSPAVMGRCIVATAARLQASGFAAPEFIVPSTSNMGLALSYIDGIMAVPGAAALVKEFAYHRSGSSLADLEAIASRGSTLAKRTSMLEYRSDDGSYRRLHEDLTNGSTSAWHQGALTGTACRGNVITAWVAGRAAVCPNARLIQQYTKYVRPGAQRIEATSQNPAFEPVAFVNVNGKYVVVVKSEGSGSFSVSGLPAGTYGVFYTTNSQYNVNLSNMTISAGQTLSTSIPGVGVITIYNR
jgi:hypothetical protein